MNSSLLSVRKSEIELYMVDVGFDEQAIVHHYSTFSTYSKREFDKSLETFKKNIMDNYDVDKVTWKDQNVLLVIDS